MPLLAYVKRHLSTLESEWQLVASKFDDDDYPGMYLRTPFFPSNPIISQVNGIVTSGFFYLCHHDNDKLWIPVFVDEIYRDDKEISFAVYEVRSLESCKRICAFSGMPETPDIIACITCHGNLLHVEGKQRTDIQVGTSIFKYVAEPKEPENDEEGKGQSITEFCACCSDALKIGFSRADEIELCPFLDTSTSFNYRLLVVRLGVKIRSISIEDSDRERGTSDLMIFLELVVRSNHPPPSDSKNGSLPSVSSSSSAISYLYYPIQWLIHWLFQRLIMNPVRWFFSTLSGLIFYSNSTTRALTAQ